MWTGGNRVRRAAAASFAALLLASCRQNIDLASLQMLSKTADDQGPAFAAIASDFYASCQRQRNWRLTGRTLVVPSVVGLTRHQQNAIAQAQRDADAAQAQVDTLVKAHVAAAKVAAAKRKADAANRAATAAVAPLIAKQKAALERNATAARAAATDEPAPPAPPTAMPTPGPAPSAAPAAAPAAAPTPTPLLTATDTHDPCQISADAAQQWQTVNLVLLNYVRALGNLAGAREKADNTFGIDGLASSLSDQAAFKKPQVDAIKGAAAQMVRDIFSAKRRDAIALSAPKAGNSLDTIVLNLEYVANVDYRIVLGQERRDINEFFRDNFHATPRGIPALQTLQYRQQWKDELTAIDKRVDAINSYVATLESFRTAHRSLLKKIATNDFSDFYSIVSTYVAEYQPKIDAITKAYAKPANAK
jgi:hypothetical protein